jgi:hypothetical protein
LLASDQSERRTWSRVKRERFRYNMGFGSHLF